MAVVIFPVGSGEPRKMKLPSRNPSISLSHATHRFCGKRCVRAKYSNDAAHLGASELRRQLYFISCRFLFTPRLTIYTRRKSISSSSSWPRRPSLEPVAQTLPVAPPYQHDLVLHHHRPRWHLLQEGTHIYHPLQLPPPLSGSHLLPQLEQ